MNDQAAAHLARLFRAVLIAGAVTACSACEPQLVVPLALDDAGRLQIWSACPAQIQLEIVGIAQNDLPLRRAIVAVMEAWADPMLPALVPVFIQERIMSEDGHSTLNFAPHSTCTGRQLERGSSCLNGRWQGLTRLYGRPAGAYLQTIEADIIINQALLLDLTRMSEVLHHELGHFFGLDHIKDATGSGIETVMSSQAPRNVAGPGRRDRDILRDAYSKACSSI